MSSSDKNWAKEYILDPLTAPQPADETGPGSHFRPGPESIGQNGTVTLPSSATPTKAGTTHEAPSSTVERSNGQPSPRHSPSHRQDAFGEQQRHRRGSSLNERFPGDQSHRPLDQLRQEKAVADKSRHVTRKHRVHPDQVDLLDGTAASGAYHHGGPYDATLYARNISYNSSPVQAVATTNQEALKATPNERIMDSLKGHRPLDGVATYPPGATDQNGQQYKYKEGDNMMIAGDPEGGAYKRWPGVEYHPDDIKGKGEPAYTVEKSLKKRDDLGEKGTEMSDQSGSGSLGQALRSEGYDDGTDQMRRSDSLTKRLGGGLKKRIGSLKRNARQDD